MSKKLNFGFYIAALIFVFCIFNFMGCVVRTYTVTKDRVDQDLTGGNRGYLTGQAPGQMQPQAKERRLTRKSRVVEVELHSPIKFETRTKVEPARPQKVQLQQEDRELTGNRGYIFGGQKEKQRFEQYIVRRGDTLQKISKRLYGTTKKWTKLYEANKDRLKAPNKIFPGQVLRIPVEIMKEPKENLK